MNEQNVEELKKKGAKLKACNERSRERIAEIAKTANDCLLNTIHPDGYVAGQYGQDYRTFGKAMCEIRKIVEDSIADVAPDYEMLARQFSRPCFDADKLAKAIEALASDKPVDYPTFYTPGWLVDLAKKLVAEGKVKVEGEQRNETSAVHLNPSPSPIISGCPSLGPKVFQSGADGTEPADGVCKTPEKIVAFCQSELQREEARQKRKIHWKCYPTKVDLAVMGRTEQNGKVYEVRISKRGDSRVQDTYGQCKVNGKTVLTVSFTGSACMLKRILTEGMQALVNHKAKRRRNSRRNYKKRAEAQALIDKELA